VAIYTYSSQTISNPYVLREALIAKGETLPVYTVIGSDISVETSVLTETQTDDAVSDANDSTLFANKEVKKRQIRDNTDTYVDVGVETWSTGVYVKLTEKVANGYYEDWQYLTANSSKLSAAQPYIVDTLTGDVDTTTTIGDILTLAVKSTQHVFI